MLGLILFEALALFVAIVLIDRRLKNRWTLMLAILTLPALASGALGQIYRVEPGTITHHDWVAGLLTNLLYMEIGGVFVSAVAAKGFRVGATLFAIVQLPICFLVGFGAMKQVTGVYL